MGPRLVVRWRIGKFGMGGLPARSDADAWLCSAERAELAALRVEKRREDWLLGRLTLKALVSAMLNDRGGTTDPSAVQVGRYATGAPYVASATDDPTGGAMPPLPLSVSISHSASRALVAATWIDDPALAGWAVHVGADVEQIAPRASAFVEDFMTDRERRSWLQTREPDRDTQANLMWSAKESVAKVLQQGLRIDTRWVTCQPDTATTVRTMASLPFRDWLEPDDHDWGRFSVETDPRLLAGHVRFSGRWAAGGGYVHTVAVGAWKRPASSQPPPLPR